MSRCPITYKTISEGRYSRKALHKLSPKLDELLDLPYSVEEQIHEAETRATKMSIQGVQPKLSAKLNVKGKVFEVVADDEVGVGADDATMELAAVVAVLVLDGPTCRTVGTFFQPAEGIHERGSIGDRAARIECCR